MLISAVRDNQCVRVIQQQAPIPSQSAIYHALPMQEGWHYFIHINFSFI